VRATDALRQKEQTSTTPQPAANQQKCNEQSCFCAEGSLEPFCILAKELRLLGSDNDKDDLERNANKIKAEIATTENQLASLKQKLQQVNNHCCAQWLTRVWHADRKLY